MASSPFNKLITELRRRNVFKVATAYAIVGWLIIQVVVAVKSPLKLPAWFDTAVIIMVIIGFPIALIVAWAFELTPEGIKKTETVREEGSIARQTGHKLNRLIITALVLLIAFLLVERIFFAGEYDSDQEIVSASVVKVEADRSVAVLPFADFSPDNDQEWFADGLTEEILNSLVRIPDLKVAARTSSFKYKGSSEDIPVIAAALGVDHILEGSVRRSPDRLRVTAQLIRASDGFHTWSETFDRMPEDAIKIQEELAASIARALNTAMDTAALKDMISVGTGSVAAYNAYLAGISNSQDENQIDNFSIDRLNEARTLDPDFAEAHYAAARHWANSLSITSIGVIYTGTDFNSAVNNFYECIRDAINSSENELDILKYRAIEAEFNLKWRQAEKLYDEYLAQRPNDFETVMAYVRMLLKLREREKANQFLKILEKERGSDITDRVELANYYHRVGNSDASDRVCRLMLRENATEPTVMYQVQRAFLWSGQVALAAEAATNYATYTSLENHRDSSLMRTVSLRQLCAEGKSAQARQVYEEILEEEWDLSYNWHIYMVMGEREKAEALLTELDKPELLRQLSFYLYYLQFDPRPYPELMKVVERENVKYIEPIEMPFALR